MKELIKEDLFTLVEYNKGKNKALIRYNYIEG